MLENRLRALPGPRETVQQLESERVSTCELERTSAPIAGGQPSRCPRAQLLQRVNCPQGFEDQRPSLWAGGCSLVATDRGQHECTASGRSGRGFQDVRK